MMRSLPVAAILGAVLLAGAAAAKKPPRGAWQVSEVTDPITGASSCLVASLDGDGSSGFSRTGYLYPVVENSSVHGLLVGVSSGGRFRLPTGDIVWRVDDKPFRELKAENNPTATSVVAPPPSGDIAAKAMADAMAFTAKLSTGMTATSTMASGAEARAMLAEMLAGQGLLFRSATSNVAYGLPSIGTFRVGQITKQGLRPIPLDDSLRSGLAKCGIAVPAPPGQ